MRRQLARDAKIAARPHEARAEQLLPEAIDRDAGRQRMLGPQAATGPGPGGCCGSPSGSGGRADGVIAFTGRAAGRIRRGTG